MTKRAILCFCGLWLVLQQTASSQGFVNLDFESADLPPTAPGVFVTFSDAFPGWVGYLGTTQTTQALYNALYLGAASVALLDVAGDHSSLVIEGEYTAWLQPGAFSGNLPVSAVIAQTGLVPSNSVSLRFKVLSADTPLEVAFDGQSLALYPLSTAPDYVLYGVDISPFAGRTAELRLTALADNYPKGNELGIDSIAFSDVPIPEPNPGPLLLVWYALLYWRSHNCKQLRITCTGNRED